MNSKQPNLWVGNQSDPNDRLKLCLSKADQAKVQDLPRGKSVKAATVTDRITGKRFKLERISCGLDCYCAIGVVGVKYPTDEEEEE